MSSELRNEEESGLRTLLIPLLISAPIQQPERHYEMRPQTRTFYLAINALLLLIFRLWYSTMAVFFTLVCLRSIPPLFSPDSTAPFIKYSNMQFTVDGFEGIESMQGENSVSIPSIFRNEYNETMRNFGPIRKVNHDACSSIIEKEFPVIPLKNIQQLSVKDQAVVKEWNATNSIRWIGLIAKGGCTLDEKLYNMQQAGYSSVIFYEDNFNKIISDRSSLLASHFKGHELNIYAALISKEAGQTILRLLEEKSYAGAYFWVSLMRRPRTLFSSESVGEIITSLAFIFALVVLSGSFIFLFGVLFKISANIYNNRSPDVIETVQEASLLILLPSGLFGVPQPRLKNIAGFKSRNLDKHSLKCDWRSGGVKGYESCPICMEDFKAGDQVRDLPCKHLFHNICLDPWLLNHNRLCPICKHDVTLKITVHL